MPTIAATMFACLLCTLVWPPAATAQIYAWHDDGGHLVLSDRPRTDNPDTFMAVGSTSIRTTKAIDPTYETDRFGGSIERYATHFDVRSDLVRAVIQVESGFDPNARSPKGAMGLMQLMPQTAAALGVSEVFDPDQNIRGGVAYLRQLLDRYGGDETLALAAYNAGPGAVSRFGNQVPPYPETQAYVEKVRSATELRAGSRRGETIYKTYEEIKGRAVPLYTNVPPVSYVEGSGTATETK